ncbi:hypothetical protein DSO57_1036063 [Entomophthora muscae]|uniref:Uncharacterized protein n=1 Tax=Entomophthora muscae TaxID=34485 RepID=A0ACC2TA20_9FUNG|nr:hypothetical protein DSO57_1036063 [Entomophthora muscae]
MKLPVTPKPIPASTTKLLLDHTNKLFGIVYITLTGVKDTIILTVASILWWYLPTPTAARQFPDTSKLEDQGWFSGTSSTKFYNKNFKLTQEDKEHNIATIGTSFLLFLYHPEFITKEVNHKVLIQEDIKMNSLTSKDNLLSSAKMSQKSGYFNQLVHSQSISLKGKKLINQDV